MEHKDNYECTNDPPKLFLITKSESVVVVLPPKNSKSNEWMAKWQEQEDGSVKNFSIIVLAQRLVRKRGEEGLYLYLKRQREGTWMKCQVLDPEK
jgi:hypothetical protein